MSLPEGAEAALERLAKLLAQPRAPISAASAGSAWEVHIRDSLSGLEFEPLLRAERISDLGSGAGLPGLVLAAALPRARVDLIESSGRKCSFIAGAIEAMGLANAEVVCERAETWAADEGAEAYDAVTIRAVGSLPVLAELASPLLRTGGVLLAWRGARNAEEEEAAARAGARLAMEPLEVRAVEPYPGSRDRHIHLLRKNGPTPDGLPRRPGMASKRPFGGERT